MMSSGAPLTVAPAHDRRGHVYLPPVQLVKRHHVAAALSGVDVDHDLDDDGGLIDGVD